MSIVLNPAPVLASSSHTPPITLDPTMVQTSASRFTSAFSLDNATGDVFNSMDATQLRKLILDTRPSSNTASGATTHSVNLCLLFFLFPLLLHPK